MGQSDLKRRRSSRRPADLLARLSRSSLLGSPSSSPSGSYFNLDGSVKTDIPIRSYQCVRFTSRTRPSLERNLTLEYKNRMPFPEVLTEDQLQGFFDECKRLEEVPDQLLFILEGNKDPKWHPKRRYYPQGYVWSTLGMFVPIPEIGPPSEDDPTSTQDASLLKTISTALPGSKRLDSIRSWAHQKTGFTLLSQSLYDPSLYEEYVVKPTKDVHEYFSRVMNWPVPADLVASPVSETSGSFPTLNSTTPIKPSLLHRIVTKIPFVSTATRILSESRGAEPSEFNGLAFDDEEESSSDCTSIPAQIDLIVETKYQKTKKEFEEFQEDLKEDLKEDIAATAKAVKSSYKKSCDFVRTSIRKTVDGAICGPANIIQATGDAADHYASRLQSWASGTPTPSSLYKVRQNLVQVTGKILDKAQEIVQVVPEISKKAPVSDAVKHGTTVEQFSHFDYVPGSKSNRQLSFSFISSSAPTVPSYELGAAQCLRDHIRSYILDESVFTGVGMGGLVAAAMVLDLDLKNVSKVVQEAFDKVDQSKVFGLIGSQSDAVYECLETLIPDNLSEEIAKKRLQLCLTKLPLLSKHTQSGFTSKDNLKRVLLASICSPPWSSSALPVDNDECYISGSWTNPMPIKDEFTVTVSSQSGAGTTICPSQNTLPKKKKTWSQLLGLKRYTPDDTSQDFENGYADTKSFLLKAYQTGDLSSLFFDRIPRA